MTTLRRSERLRNKPNSTDRSVPNTTDRSVPNSNNLKDNINTRYDKKNPSNNQFKDYDKFSSNNSFSETIKFQEFCGNNGISYFNENKLEIDGFLETLFLIFSQYIAFLVMVVPIIINKVLDTKVYHDVVYYFCYRNCIIQHWIVQFYKNFDKEKMKVLTSSMNFNGEHLKELYIRIKKKNEKITLESVENYIQDIKIIK